MITLEPSEQEEWVESWLNTVAVGKNTMSQRKLTSIEKHAGNLKTVKRIAQRMGIHLVLLEDDEGNKLVAASLNPFKVIC